MAMQAGLFNIGSEGQMYIGGLGLTVAMLAFDQTLPAWLLIPAAMIGAALFGALWGFARLPAGQARQPHRRHHHHVQLHRRQPDELHHREVPDPPGEQNTASRAFAESGEMPRLNSGSRRWAIRR
jgi:simple sugar transport system permease protein